MRLVTFSADGTTRLGVLEGQSVIDLSSRFPGGMLELLRRGAEGLAEAHAGLEMGSRIGARLPLGSVTLLAPVPRPGKILGVGRNYGAHAAEGGLAAQEKPRIFIKLSTAVIGTGAPIRKPASITKLDYETELAVVIGASGRDIAEADALLHVAGYTILNDVSARELQFDVSPPQTSLAKSMDTFCPMGPCLATPDEFADVADIRLHGWVDGEQVQDDTTAHLIFSVPVLISYLSKFVTLESGDVIATGTPAGVGAFRKPPRFLRAGDVVRMEIPEIGVLENPVV